MLIRTVLTAAIAAADPATGIRSAVSVRGSVLSVAGRRYDLRRYHRVLAVGAGKAGASMAAALESRLGTQLHSGFVVVKYGHTGHTRRIALEEAGHPVPDDAGERAARRLLALVKGLTKHDLLFVLLSGGASSLLPVPAAGITLRDKQRTTDVLLRSGATIQEVNAVRKHISAIKGGQLAAATSAPIVSLVLSDVLGDELASIGSGPAAPDPTTYGDAEHILKRYDAWDKVPAAIRRVLTEGTRRQRPDTPKPGARLFHRVQHHVIANSATAVNAAASAARRLGWRTMVLTTTLVGEAREAARVVAAIAREMRASSRPMRPPVCVIAGGETTVRVRGDGRGGRAQEFALAAAIEIRGLPDVWVAAVGTDGSDGPTDAAGAIVDGGTVTRARRVGVDARDALGRNDSHGFFRRAGGLIRTGPTGTNVNDVYVLLVG